LLLLIAFFVNGIGMGVAFHGLPADHLYPAVNIFNDTMRCSIKAKPAPLFVSSS
jgi:hypothetical protein